MRGRTLVVDDDQSMCEVLNDGLVRLGFRVTWRLSADGALDVLAAEDIDVVVTDLNMRSVSGLDLCQRIVANRPDLPVVMITAFASLETAVAAIRAGAYDFIAKPFDTDALAIVLDRAVQHRHLRDEVKRLRLAVTSVHSFGELIGASRPMRSLFDLLVRVSDSDASVMIQGETGTGKELVARAIHRQSDRKDGPFVAINCAAVPEALLESELFGHTRGAFTDAKTARVGLFHRAGAGTLFLDEIGDMPMGLQVKLLRALQERSVRPVGGDVEIPFDVRIISATNRDIEAAAEDGRFRADLLFRINVIPVDVPPLRSRGNDVLLLAQHFLGGIAARSGRSVIGISPGAAQSLLGYDWPGNVRELQNCIERAVALTRFEQIALEDLPEKVQRYSRSHVVVSSGDPSELLSLEEVERRYILHVLDAARGNKSIAARTLKVDRRTLYRKLERWGAAIEDDDGDSG